MFLHICFVSLCVCGRVSLQRRANIEVGLGIPAEPLFRSKNSKDRCFFIYAGLRCFFKEV